MIRLSPTPMLGVSSQSSLNNSQSLSSGAELENRVPRSGLEHIAEILTRISATLDRSAMGKLSEQGGGESLGYLASDKITAPSLVTASYPHEGGVAQAERSVLSQKGTIHHRR